MVEKNDYLSYFLNDLYDDEIINAKFHGFQNRLYHSILKGKSTIQGNRIINGDVFDIKRNEGLNKKYGLPDKSCSLHLNFCLIPFYSQNEFIEKYGFETVFSSLNILTDDTIFPSNIEFFINEAYIYEIKIVVRENETILFIPTSETSGTITINSMEEILNNSGMGMWTIRIKPKSDYYFAYAARVNIFTGTKIYLNSLTNSKLYNTETKSDYWTLYMSFDPESVNLMTATTVTLHEDEKGNTYFEVPENFKNFIYNHINMIKCFIVNECDCCGNGIYKVSNDTNPIFQIPYKKNPIPLNNIIVWEYDTETNRKIHPLETLAIITYPNIYDFSGMFESFYFWELYDNSKRLVVDSDLNSIVLVGNYDLGSRYDLYLEWVEPMNSISAFDTPIQDYMDFYNIGNINGYMTMKLNKTAHPIVLNYEPIDSQCFTSEDYFKSEFHGDYRAWRLHHFINILNDNPNRFDEYFHRMYDKTKCFITRSYTYKSHHHIYERSILTNRDHVNDATDEVLTFSEPTTYMRFHDANDTKKYCNLFINGILRSITHVTKYGHTLYIYFPTSYIANHETIHIDVNLSRDPSEMESEVFYLGKEKPIFDFEDASFKRKNCISNLLITEYTTNRPVKFGKDFELELKVDLIRLKYDGIDKIDTISGLDSDVDLYESTLELFVPVGHDAFVLDKSDIHVTIPPINNIDTFSFKKINLENLVIKRTTAENRYRITTTDFYYKWEITLTEDIIYTNSVFYIKKIPYIMDDFKDSEAPHKFACYINGKRVNIITINNHDTSDHYEVYVPIILHAGVNIYS